MTTNKLLPILEKKLGGFTFAIFLRSARSSMGLSQIEFAKKLKIEPGTLCDIEKGRQLVSISLAMKIAKIARLSVDQAIESAIQDQLNKAKIRKIVRLEDAA